MKYNILTIFPNLIEEFSKTGIVHKSLTKKIVDMNIINLRNFTSDPNRTIDDKVYGGGPGMVLKYEPIKDSLDSIEDPGYIIYLSPQGNVLTQSKLKALSLNKNITFICGRYEGVDQRVLDSLIDEEISIGDYVISGGENACMVIIEGITRLLKGVVDDYQSILEDSFQNGILDHPHYTRPDSIDGMDIPDVLNSGDHKMIEIWRRKQALGATWLKRPDLLKNVKLSEEDDKLLKEYIEECKKNEHK